MLEHSRGLLLAEHASEVSPSRLANRLEASTMAISVDESIPMTIFTAKVMLTTLRRGPGRLVLYPGTLHRRDVELLESAVADVDSERPLVVGLDDGRQPTARVHIGPYIGERAIRVLPDGSGAHVAGSRNAVLKLTHPANGLGAVCAAAMGATEVFKYTAGVVRDRRVIHRHLQFCPVSLSSDLSLSPNIGRDLRFDLSLLGVGAIGTAIVLILDGLEATGRLLAVDRQRFARENLGTYSIGGAADVASAPWKVDLAKRVLSRFEVVTSIDPVDTLPAAIDRGELPRTHVVLTALDSPEARRDAQRLWPDRLIDAATGETMVGMHDCAHGIDPCMMCVFPLHHDRPSGVERLAHELGLVPELLAQGDALLAAQHLEGLTFEQRTRLEPFLGKPICGLASAESLTGDASDDYQASVAFVSMQAACLSVGRLLARHLHRHVGSNMVQYDALCGPQAATIERMHRRDGCVCATRAAAIQGARSQRSRSRRAVR